ncbi:MAG: DEAD/DEAH box helicase [Roseivirga sp.]|uniref:DEAD/DEAH box helicase n=1 Tax=Roseivirga sp. TaxID=1964215 RepID=UPI001B098E59|nr:DEAD/DEAH box helicase [Roseivirga sp.]MBO6662128.1 DEAD/DEAH box helicase [Roseivirga sp.]MBO6759769.1 DEAD/DEAH box helicase [Roseivirga sp.]MBO6910144.1 DEAD/DEAH box helicase [Roseivirga sp.]
MSFATLGLSKSLLHAINKKGYTTPSPIQEKAIPHILKGSDVMASAQTGTGKTAGFTLPLLQILSEGHQPRRRPIRALVLTPTRELAAQVHENVKTYSEFLHVESAVIFGGVNQNPQIRALRNGVDVLIATPGRLLDLVGQGHISLAHVEILVLDEADRMLDMGFHRDIKKILPLLPSKRQNLLFSATFSKEIKELAGSFLQDPVLVEVNPENSASEQVQQFLYHVDRKQKSEVVLKMIKEGDWQQVLIFMRTKHACNRLSVKLNKNGITAAAIHGEKSQGARTKALAGFKKGTVRVLVATDIAARGLDIPLLPYVVNFELPKAAEDYVHRIGRTGRAGANGEAISLLDAEEFPLVKGIEKLLEHRLNIEVIKGFEPTGDLSAASKPKSTQTTQPRKKSGQQKSNKPKSNSTSEKPYRSKRFNSKRRRRG